MPRINTKTAKEFLELELAFTTNGAFSAEESGPNYVVKSYGSAIGVVDHQRQRVYLNTANYSATTSKHQRITNKALTLVAVCDGYLVEEISNPAAFEVVTGYKARLVGANKTGGN
jgi:hypothetical protein